MEIEKKIKKFQDVVKMDEVRSDCSDDDKKKIEGIIYSLTFHHFRVGPYIDWFLAHLGRMKELIKHVDVGTVGPSADASGLQRVFATNKMARRIAGPIFSDVLRREIEVVVCGRLYVTHVQLPYLKVF